jgi:hypothetical protein
MSGSNTQSSICIHEGKPANKGPVPKAWAFLFTRFPLRRTRSEDSADRSGRKSFTDVPRQESEGEVTQGETSASTIVTKSCPGHFECKSSLGFDCYCKTFSVGNGRSQSNIFFISPMKDFLSADPAEIRGFLINLFYVGGRLHHTFQGETVNKTKGVSQLVDALFQKTTS